MSERSSVALKGEIDALRAGVKPLLERIDGLQHQYRLALSREWIAANGVTRDQVLVEGDDDLPYCFTLRSVGEWMQRTGNARRWVAWNGRIHSAAEVIAGRTGRDMPGRLEDVPG